VDPVIRLLRDLVAIDSVNPTLVPGAAGERQIAEAIAAHMRRIGLDVALEPAAPGLCDRVVRRFGRKPLR